MKKISLIVLLILLKISLFAQSYDDVLNYYFNGTPVNGVKIKTNIPFTNGTQMPTVHITGFNYVTQNPIDLDIVWYIYGGQFINYGASSAGAYTPPILLSNENGKVVIYINDKSYYQRFKVSVYALGMSEQTTWFTGWTTADEALNGTNTVQLTYTNKLGNIIVNGNAGIGTSTPQAKLDVNGNIYSNGKIFIGTPDASTTAKIAPYSLAVNGYAIFTKAVVKLNSAWPDYVFTRDYKMPKLDSLESFINTNRHLPGVPTAEDVKKNGIDLGENQAVLLKKIEELTLFTIEMNKQSEELKKALDEQAKKIQVQSEKIVELEKKLKALEENSGNQAIK